MPDGHTTNPSAFQNLYPLRARRASWIRRIQAMNSRAFLLLAAALLLASGAAARDFDDVHGYGMPDGHGWAGGVDPGWGGGGRKGIPGFAGGGGGGWGNMGGGWGAGYGSPSGGFARGGGIVRPSAVCRERGRPCYKKKLTCPAKCFTSYSRSGKNYAAGGGGGGCTIDCNKCVAYC